MPNDVLVKVDRASMRYGLEARSPFLDHRLVEFAFSVDRDYKVRGGSGKMLLKRLLRDFLPAQLIDQPKMGFAVPIAGWLRNELREWAQDLLADSGEHFSRPALDKIWSDHQVGNDRQDALWNVLMLLSWLKARGR